MDKGKLVRLVLIPITLGLVVTLIVRQLLGAPEGQTAAAPVESVNVVIVSSKEPVPARTKLTEQHLTVKAVPRAALIGNEFSSVADLAGMISLVELEPGEIVLKHRVVEEGKGALPFQIPKGYRAVTIRIDELSGVAGHPEPGDLVDLVLFLPEKTPQRTGGSTRMLLESVRVLGKGLAPSVAKAGGGANLDGPKLTSLTLALTPDAAVEVALAEQIGYVKVLLRPALTEPNAGRIQKQETNYGM